MTAPDTAVRWAKPADLREREHGQQIECQNVVSGRWKPAFDHYWDDCVIEVPWRWRRVCPTCGDKRVVETPHGNTTASGHPPTAWTPCPTCRPDRAEGEPT